MLLGAIIALEEKWARRNRWSVLGAFLLLGMAGMVVSAVQASNSARDSSRLSDALGHLSESTREIGRVAALNTDLQERLLKQSEMISELTRKGIGSVTGGSSFCYLSLTDREGDSGQAALLCEGPFPIYELQIRAVDVGALDDIKKRLGRQWTFEDMTAATTNLDIGTMPPDTSRWGVALPIRDTRRVQYNVFFTARNGFWSELIRLAKVDGKWRQATKVQADFAGVKHERHRMPWVKIDDGFPPAELDWK